MCINVFNLQYKYTGVLYRTQSTKTHLQKFLSIMGWGFGRVLVGGLILAFVNSVHSQQLVVCSSHV